MAPRVPPPATTPLREQGPNNNNQATPKWGRQPSATATGIRLSRAALAALSKPRDEAEHSQAQRKKPQYHRNQRNPQPSAAATAVDSTIQVTTRWWDPNAGSGNRLSQENLARWDRFAKKYGPLSETFFKTILLPGVGLLPHSTLLLPSSEDAAPPFPSSLYPASRLPHWLIYASSETENPEDLHPKPWWEELFQNVPGLSSLSKDTYPPPLGYYLDSTDGSFLPLVRDGVDFTSQMQEDYFKAIAKLKELAILKWRFHDELNPLQETVQRSLGKTSRSLFALEHILSPSQNKEVVKSREKRYTDQWESSAQKDATLLSLKALLPQPVQALFEKAIRAFADARELNYKRHATLHSWKELYKLVQSPNNQKQEEQGSDIICFLDFCADDLSFRIAESTFIKEFLTLFSKIRIEDYTRVTPDPIKEDSYHIALINALATGTPLYTAHECAFHTLLETQIFHDLFLLEKDFRKDLSEMVHGIPEHWEQLYQECHAMCLQLEEQRQKNQESSTPPPSGTNSE